MSSPFGRVGRLLRFATAGLSLLSLACAPDADLGASLEEIRSGAVATDAAIARLRELQRLDPGDAEINFHLGRLLVSEGLPNHAIPPLHRATQDEAFAVRAGLALAEILLDTQNPEAAIQVAERVISGETSPLRARLIIARAHASLQHWEEAIAGADAVLEREPAHREAMLLQAASLDHAGLREEAMQRWEEIETAARESDALGLAVRACLGRSGIALVDALEAETLRATTADLDRCASRYPDRYEPVRARLHLLARLRDVEGIDRLIRSSADMIRGDAARVLDIVRVLREAGEAVEILESGEHLAEISDDPRAWALVAELRRELGDPEGAVAAIDRAIASQPVGGEELVFTKADILLDAGHSAEALGLARTLEEPAFAGLIEGRAALVDGKPRQALSTIDSVIGRWPNNAGARVMAARAARQAGEFARAMEEYRAAFRARAPAEVGLEAAAMALGLERYADGLEAALWYLKSTGEPTLEALRLTARLALAVGNRPASHLALRQLESKAGAAAPRLELARRAIDRGRPTDARRILESIDPLVSREGPEVVVLDQVELLLATGLADRAQALCRGLSEEKDPVALAGKVCGRLLLERGEADPARASFESALAVDPDDPVALEGLGAALEMAGEPEQALEVYRLARANGSGTDARLAAARVLSQLGRNREATTELRRALRDHPESWRAADELARLLLDAGTGLDEALVLAKRATRIARSPRTADTLTRVHMRRGELDDALAAARAGTEAHPGSGVLFFRLAEVLLQNGATSQAEEALRRSIDLGGFVEISEARARLEELGAS